MPDPPGSSLPWEPRALADLARRKLAPDAAAYFEATAQFPPTQENEAAWSRWRFAPRVARDVGAVSTAVDLLGVSMGAPILLAPCAFAGEAHPAGELAVARAAGAAGSTFVLSAASTHASAAVARAATGPAWLQCYLPRDDAECERMVDRAAVDGFRALVVTLDAPVASMRVRGYVPGTGASIDPIRRARPHASPLNPSVTWRTLARVVARTSLPVLAKGILRADDARAAVDSGCAGVIVSNHGERQLDGVVPTAAVLEEIASAIAPAPVLVDGGVRSGRDVLRAVCLGARAALIGRPYLWALAIAGEAGVTELLTRFRVELENALALTGCAHVSDADRSLLVRYP